MAPLLPAAPEAPLEPPFAGGEDDEQATTAARNISPGKREVRLLIMRVLFRARRAGCKNVSLCSAPAKIYFSARVALATAARLSGSRAARG